MFHLQAQIYDEEEQITCLNYLMMKNSVRAYEYKMPDNSKDSSLDSFLFLTREKKKT